MHIKANLEQKMLLLAIVFLPFTHFRLELPIAGGEFARIFLFLGICIYLYKIYTKQVTLDRFEKFSFFYLTVCFLWQGICTIIGVLEFSYYDMIYLEQMEKLRYLLQNLEQLGLCFDDLTAIKMWLSLRLIKDCFLNVLFSYGISLWIYHLYKNYKTDTEKCNVLVSHVTVAVSILCLILVMYSAFETGYLWGSKLCADIISAINPLLYEVGSVHGWWPPLLSPGRLRSLFAEPSFFGIISVIIFFILFYKNLTTKEIFYSCLLSVFVMMTVMTRSRTAIPLFIGQMGLLLLYVFAINRKYIKGVVKIIAIVGLSFFVGLYLMSGFKPVPKTAGNINKTAVANAKPGAKNTGNTQKPKVVTTKPVAKTGGITGKPSAKDVTKSNKTTFDISSAMDSFTKRSVPFADKASARSDMTRLNSTKAYFLTGLQHPVFGVGKGLSNAYADANYMIEDVWRDNIWSKSIRQKGVLQSPVPVLNHWSGEMAQFGIVGLFLFLLPVFYIFHKLIVLFPKGMSVEIACVTIAYIASNVAMFSNAAFLSYYILTGILLVLLHNKTEGREALR